MRIMRNLAILTIVLLLNACISHPADCSRFRNGKFKSVAKGRFFFIERKVAFQKEYVVGVKDSAIMTFNVKWLNDYTYTIQPTPESHKKYPAIPKDAMMTIETSEQRPHHT